MEVIEVKIADIILNDKIIDIIGQVNAEALVFIKHYDVEMTSRILNKLNEKEYIINKKLSRVGYFFDEDIDNFSIEPEVINYLLNNYYKKNINFAAEIGIKGKAVYYDLNYKNLDIINLSVRAKRIYYEHNYSE
ncbi:MAG: hypothetical protein AB9835_06350 [Eubacteriales bacterium]